MPENKSPDDSDSYASSYTPDKCIYQDDGRIFHRGGYVYDDVTAVHAWQYDAGKLTLVLDLVSRAQADMTVEALFKK